MIADGQKFVSCLVSLNKKESEILGAKIFADYPLHTCKKIEKAVGQIISHVNKGLNKTEKIKCFKIVKDIPKEKDIMKKRKLVNSQFSELIHSIYKIK